MTFKATLDSHLSTMALRVKPDSRVYRGGMRHSGAIQRGRHDLPSSAPLAQLSRTRSRWAGMPRPVQLPAATSWVREAQVPMRAGHERASRNALPDGGPTTSM